MGTTWDHEVRELRAAELDASARLAEHVLSRPAPAWWQGGIEQWATWTAAQAARARECRATKACHEIATHETRYKCPAGGHLRVRVSRRHSRVCGRHAREFATKHGIEIEAAA